jgi:hypothetical protein
MSFRGFLSQAKSYLGGAGRGVSPVMSWVGGFSRGATGLSRARRVALFGGAITSVAALAGTRGMVKGYNMMVRSPEDMQARARRLGIFGDEEYFRRDGRMPSNHLGHSGLGLALSRTRHGHPGTL